MEKDNVDHKSHLCRLYCRDDSTKMKALLPVYLQFIEVLAQIADERDKFADALCKARGLSNKMCRLETGVNTVF